MTTDETGYAAAVARATEDARNAASEVERRMTAPRASLQALAMQYADRLDALGGTIEAAERARPYFNRWEHNFKQRLFKLDSIESGRVIFRLLDTDNGDGVHAHPITSLQIFDPFRDAAVANEIGSEYPRWDFRPAGSQVHPRYPSQVAETPYCFAVVVPWMRSFEYRISLQSRLGQSLSAEQIEEMKRDVDADAKIWRRTALFLDGQIEEAMAFCRHVLDAILEAQTLTASRASAHLEKHPPTPALGPSARKKRSPWGAALLWVVGLAVAGLIAFQLIQ